MIMKIRLIIFCLVTLCAAGLAAANEEFLGWDVTGQTQYGQSPLAPTTIASAIRTSTDLSLTRGSGLQTAKMTAVEGWGGYNWTQRSEQNATSFPFNDYFTFGFTVAPGRTISLSEIDETYRRDSAAPNVGALQYSLDGGQNYNDFANLTFGGTSSGGTMLSASIAQTAALQHLVAGTTVLFRQANWYSMTTPNSAGNWFIANGTGDDLAIYGTSAGDVDGNSTIDTRDISAMLDALTNMTGFEASHGISAQTAATMLDLNGDSQITNADLQWLLNYLKAGAGGTVAVPEPATSVLGIIAGAALVVIGIKARHCGGV